MAWFAAETASSLARTPHGTTAGARRTHGNAHAVQAARTVRGPPAWVSVAPLRAQDADASQHWGSRGTWTMIFDFSVVTLTVSQCAGLAANLDTLWVLLEV